MKKQITLITLAALSTVAVANAQDFIAGWDFSGVNTGTFGASLGTTVIGGESDFASIIVDESGLAQVVSRGQAPAAGTFQALNGFDNAATRSYADAVPTGQQGLEFSQYAGDFSFTVDFGGTVDNAVIDFAAVTAGTLPPPPGAFFADYFSVSYSVGGSSTTYGNGNANFGGADQYLFSLGTAWSGSETAFAGFPSTIDLAGINGVESITFTVLDNSQRIAFDNIAVRGTNFTPVPEPSTYAAIAGVLALGFVAYRRRK